MNSVNVVRAVVVLGAIGVLLVSMLGAIDAEGFELPRTKEDSAVTRIVYLGFVALSLFVMAVAASLRYRSYQGRITKSNVELIERYGQREIIRINGLNRTLVVPPSGINSWRAAGLDIDSYVIVTYYDSIFLPFLAPTVDSFEKVEAPE